MAKQRSTVLVILVCLAIAIDSRAAYTGAAPLAAPALSPSTSLRTSADLRSEVAGCALSGVAGGVAEEQVLSEGASAGWWAVVQEDIRQSEHHVTWQDRTDGPDLPPAYRAPHRDRSLHADSTLATIAVTSLADIVANDGQCTLREAITAANTDTVSGDATGECSAGLGADRIDLADITGTITLTSALPDISSDIVFNGPGASALIVRRDFPAGNYRIFTIGVGVTVAISGFTVSNGHVENGLGGGIYNAGTLTLTNMTVRNNEVTVYGHGGGIYNAITGTLTLSNSTVSSNRIFMADDSYGGGIHNAGTLTLNNSVVSTNRTSYGDRCHGGGIHNEGTLTLNNTIVDGSNASEQASSGNGGGIHNIGSGSSVTLNNSTVSADHSSSFGDGDGGGLWNGGGATMVLNNSTVTLNGSSDAGGGIYNTGSSTVTLNSSTIGLSNFAGGNGGGIWNGNGGTVSFKNSIVAGNGAYSAGPDCYNTAALVSLDYNLVGDDSGCTFASQANDQINIAPRLGELQDNGGPTETRALLPGSPAIDATPLASCTDHQGTPVTTDQRGVPRPQGTACDIGAYEAVQKTLHLPSVMYNHTPPVTFPLHIGDAIPRRSVAYQGEVFYTTSVQVPDELPSGGHFYFSSQRDGVAEALVDDALFVLLDGAEIFTYDFSTSGYPVPAILEVPRTTMEQLAGQAVTIEYRDLYAILVEATAMWLIWSP